MRAPLFKILVAHKQIVGASGDQAPIRQLPCSWSVVTEVLVLQLVTHVFCLNVLLLAHELFKFTGWKFNFSSVKFNKCHWRKKLSVWRGKHSSHLRVNVKNKKDKNQQMQLKKMMLQMLQQPQLNPRKENSSSCGWKSIHGWFTRKIAITAVRVLSSLHRD